MRVLFSLCTSLFFALSLSAKKGEFKGGNTNENLLRHPRVYNMAMSPDGKYAASVAPMGDDGDRGIVIFNLDDGEIHRSFKWRGKDIDSLVWTTNEDVAFNLSKWGAFVEGVFSVNVNRKLIYPLVANDAVVNWVDTMPESEDAWIWISDGYKVKSGLLKLRATGTASERQGDGTYDVPPSTQNRLLTNRIPDPPGEVFGWMTDKASTPRVTLRFYEGRLEYLHRYGDDEDWSALPLDPEDWEIQLFGADPTSIFVAGYNGHDTKGLYEYNIEQDEIGELVYRDDYYDFADTVKYIYFNKQVVGFHYMRDSPQFVWLIPELAKTQEIIDGALPDTINVIHNASSDFSRLLIHSYSDRIPSQYLVLDLKAKTLKQITSTAPWLDPDQLATTTTFHFDTDDGLKLEGYLTLPREKKGPHPTVVLVHGGPWVRDTGGYHDETQFFAKNGYAVLRINYRGSSGYGKKISFDQAYAFREMQDDITAGVELAIKHGVADPKRIAIMGASFGGYSALCGATFEPDLYRCAITNMGVFDWEEMIKSRKRQSHQYSHHKLLEQLGDPKDNENAFESISPIYHVDKIKIPIFVIHGKDDRNVSIRQSKQLRNELREHDIEHETLFVADEGHNVFSLNKRVKTYNQILAFLAKHME